MLKTIRQFLVILNIALKQNIRHNGSYIPALKDRLRSIRHNLS